MSPAERAEARIGSVRWRRSRGPANLILSHPFDMIERMFDMMTNEALRWEDSEHPSMQLQLEDSLEPSEPDLNGPETIPASLDEMEPGVFLAVILEHTDIDRLTPHERVVVLRAYQRMASHHQAQDYAAMAAITAAMEQDPDEATWPQEVPTRPNRARTVAGYPARRACAGASRVGEGT